MEDKKIAQCQIVHVGIVVKDIKEAASKAKEIFGISDPIVVGCHGDAVSDYDSKMTYYGVRTRGSCYNLNLNLGSIVIEYIQPVGTDSIWSDFLREHGQGIHHLGFETCSIEEIDKTWSGYNIASIQSGEWEGGKFTYFDASSVLGCCLELIEYKKGGNT